MDAVKYFKEKKRMTKCNAEGSCGIFCSNCPLSYHNNGIGIVCKAFELNYQEKAVDIVEKWSEEHKQKTKKQVFYEKFPNAPKDDDGIPQICPDDIWLGDCGKCIGDCVTCWNEPAPEEYQEYEKENEQ